MVLDDFGIVFTDEFWALAKPANNAEPHKVNFIKFNFIFNY